MGKEVGQYIQELRTNQGIGLRRLSDQIGLSAAHLSMVEHGRRETSVVVLYNIVRALNGDFVDALQRLALDAGVPAEVLLDREMSEAVTSQSTWIPPDGR